MWKRWQGNTAPIVALRYSVENLASDRLHTKAGFKPIRTEYLKVLKPYPGESHPC